MCYKWCNVYPVFWDTNVTIAINHRFYTHLWHVIISSFLLHQLPHPQHYLLASDLSTLEISEQTAPSAATHRRYLTQYLIENHVSSAYSNRAFRQSGESAGNLDMETRDRLSPADGDVVVSMGEDRSKQDFNPFKRLPL